MSDEAGVICEVCREAEVNEPILDYCHVCHRKLCDDCIVATNDEHGLRFCRACDILETLNPEAVLPWIAKQPSKVLDRIMDAIRERQQVIRRDKLTRRDWTED